MRCCRSGLSVCVDNSWSRESPHRRTSILTILVVLGTDVRRDRPAWSHFRGRDRKHVKSARSWKLEPLSPRERVTSLLCSTPSNFGLGSRKWMSSSTTGASSTLRRDVTRCAESLFTASDFIGASPRKWSAQCSRRRRENWLIAAFQRIGARGPALTVATNQLCRSSYVESA